MVFSGLVTMLALFKSNLVTETFIGCKLKKMALYHCGTLQMVEQILHGKKYYRHRSHELSLPDNSNSVYIIYGDAKQLSFKHQ